MKKATPQSAKSKVSLKASTIYKDFEIYTGAKKPLWHPVKKMRYVFFRMIGGCTVTDALAEIKWNASEFWHLVDLKRHTPFREEYKRAKLLQARAFSDNVVIIADGRDRITQAREAKIEALVRKSLKSVLKGKDKHGRQMMLEHVLGQLSANDSSIIARNKLQIDAAKWIAKTSAPAEYSETTKVAVGSPTPTGDVGASVGIAIQFVNPDGSVVEL